MQGSGLEAGLTGVRMPGLLEAFALMKSKLALITLVIAVVATPLILQQLALTRARRENQDLIARLNAATAEPSAEVLARQTADAAELERLRKEHLELLRLRGEIVTLRQAAARAAQLERELAAQRAVRPATAAAAGAAATPGEPDPQALEETKRIGIAKLNLFKHYALAIHLFAADHGDQLPGSLADLRPYLSPEAVGTGDNPPILPEGEIELLYRGKLTDIKNSSQTIIARERQPWLSPRGTWCRTYAFADFRAAMSFVNAVAESAERVQHHPDILVRYSKVTLTLSTHDANGITTKDFDFAREADRLAGA